MEPQRCFAWLPIGLQVTENFSHQRCNRAAASLCKSLHKEEDMPGREKIGIERPPCAEPPCDSKEKVTPYSEPQPPTPPNSLVSRILPVSY